MPTAVDGELVAWGDASRRFRTTDVTVKDVRIRSVAGETLVFGELKMQLAVARSLARGMHGRFYLSSGKTDDALYGFRVPGGPHVFDGDTGFDAWIIAKVYLLFGILFFWTIIGIFVAWIGWRLHRRLRDARQARQMFEADSAPADPTAAR